MNRPDNEIEKVVEEFNEKFPVRFNGSYYRWEPVGEGKIIDFLRAALTAQREAGKKEGEAEEANRIILPFERRSDDEIEILKHAVAKGRAQALKEAVEVVKQLNINPRDVNDETYECGQEAMRARSINALQSLTEPKT